MYKCQVQTQKKQQDNGRKKKKCIAGTRNCCV